MRPHSRIALILLAGGAACCHPKGVTAFTVPERACPGDSITLGWEVNGKATLTTTVEGEQPTTVDVPSSSSLPFTVEATTKFRLTAPDVREGDPHAYADRAVTIPDDRFYGNTAVCDESTRKCVAHFRDPSPNGAKARRIASPTYVWQGKDHEVTFYVTHDTLAHQPLGAGEKTRVDTAAGGEWTFEMDMPEGFTAETHPMMKVKTRLTCPAAH